MTDKDWLKIAKRLSKELVDDNSKESKGKRMIYEVGFMDGVRMQGEEIKELLHKLSNTK